MSTAPTITKRFASVVATHGDRIALAAGGREIRYTELDAAANVIAAELRSAGVRKESVVALHLDRSTECIAAMLAVLKAGAAYVVLPPDQPAARLRAIVEDAVPAVVVSRTRDIDDRLALRAPVLTLWDVFGDCAEQPGLASDDDDVRAASLAYVIYTSGSTGTPKGVAVTHDNVVTLVTEQKYVAFGPDEVFLQLAPLTFDASAFEIWGALLNGAKLVVPDGSYAAIGDLPRLLARERVSVLLLTPPLFHEMARSHAAVLADVRRLIVGGEAMALDAVAAYRSAARSRRGSLANVYGPTEATTLATYFDVMADEPAVIPIDSAIRGAAVYMLDERLEPVTAGGVGEIYLGGRCVTRGYVGRPGLTSSAYMPDPFGAPGGRMYRTGDLGRRAADGEIEFLGRLDRQVKIRGHRVELAEPEIVLRRHPSVRDAAVVARTTEVGSQQLVAFVATSGEDVTEQLRRLCADELPSYMQPALIVPVRDRIPLTSTGKTDRDALLDLLSPSRSDAPDPAVNGDGGALAMLSEVWRRILGLDAVTPDDDFFALGGDSLLAIRVASEADAAGWPLALTDLFATPTLGDLAAVLEAAGRRRDGHTAGASMAQTRHLLEEQWSALLAVPVGADDDFFAVGGDSLLAIRAVADGQGAGLPLTLELLFQYPQLSVLADVLDSITPTKGAGWEDASEDHAIPCPATAMQLGFLFEETALGIAGLYIDVVSRCLRGPLDAELLRQAIRLTALRHSAVRTHFDLTSYGVPAQVIGNAATPEVRIRDEPAASSDQVQAKDIEECRAPFDTERDESLLRVVVTPLPPDRFQLTYGFHHAIMDGWSETIFASDLLSTYDRLLGGEAPELPPLAVTPADFARLEMSAIESKETRRFWVDRLHGVDVPTLPVTREPAGKYEIRIGEVSPSDMAVLGDAARRLRVGTKSVVVAVHLAALAELQGTTRPITGLVMNGRPDSVGGDELVGLFLNIVPFTASCDGGWDALVQATFESERAIVPHRRFPYAELHGFLARPLEVNCNYVNFHRAADVRDLTRVTVEARHSVAFNSFPLTVDLVRSTADDGLMIGITCDRRRLDAGYADTALRAHLDAFRRLIRDIAAGRLATRA